MRLAVVSLILLMSSCMVGGGGTVTFHRVQYPVSGNEQLLDQNGNGVEVSNSSTYRGRLKVEARFWSIIYGFMQLTDEKDLGPEINQQIEEMGGNAMVNAELKSSPCGWDHFTVLIGILPFIPGCTHTELTGDVIKIGQ